MERGSINWWAPRSGRDRRRARRDKTAARSAQRAARRTLAFRRVPPSHTHARALLQLTRLTFYYCTAASLVVRSRLARYAGMGWRRSVQGCKFFCGHTELESAISVLLLSCSACFVDGIELLHRLHITFFDWGALGEA